MGAERDGSAEERRHRLGFALRALAADLVEERRRRMELEREVAELRARLAALEVSARQADAALIRRA